MPSTGNSCPVSQGMEGARYRMLVRGLALYGLWLVMMQSVHVADLAFGLCAAGAATWASLRLAPPAAGTLRLAGLLLLLPHFLWQSVRAGVDVARRVLGPQVAIDPGLIDCPLDLPPGLARNSFTSFTSLLPGTVPCGDHGEGCVYHCLDITQPVVRQLHEEQRRLAGVFLHGRGHD